jgi:hypothetical protein
MKVQKNRPLVAVIVVAVGSLVGAMFASFLIGGSGMLGRYSFGDTVRDCIILSLGAILGGLVFSWASKR